MFYLFHLIMSLFYRNKTNMWDKFYFTSFQDNVTCIIKKFSGNVKLTINQGPALRSVRPSVLPSICPSVRLFVRDLLSGPCSQVKAEGCRIINYEKFLSRMPMVKGFAVILNEVFRSRVKVILDHAKYFSEHIYSPFSSILIILNINRAFE